MSFNFELVGTAIRIQQDSVGFKIQSRESRFTVILGRNSLGTSSNPPYGGWEDFMKEARANWDDWKRVVGSREIIRIGLRYINRIDVPFNATGFTRLEDYFRFYLHTPEVPEWGPMATFGVNAEILINGKPVKLTINHAPTPSPLVQRSSFLLDLDLGIDSDLPRNEKALWEMIESLRSMKNSAFEACITDKTRELFS